MKIKEQVCTLEQARRLSELGAKLDTVFKWIVEEKGRENSPSAEIIYSGLVTEPADGILLPAPNSSELGMLLPSMIMLDDEDLFLQGTIGNRGGGFYCIWFQSSIDNVEWDEFPAVEKDTEAEARAEALIWLIENGYVNVSDLEL